MQRFLLIVFLFLIQSVWPTQEARAGFMSKTGTTTAQFLKIQVGARAVSMGGAYVALADDISSIYWNPAGLALMPGRGAVNFVYSNWLADTRFNFAAAALKAGNFGTIGVSITALTMPDMKVRNEFEPEGTGEYFSAMSTALGLSYARNLTNRFSMGGSVKYILEKIWHMSASALAFDIGLIYRTGAEWLTLGISVSNLGSKMQYTGKDAFVYYDFDPDQYGDSEHIFANLQTDYWDLPLMVRFGLAAHLVNTEKHLFTAALETRHPNDNTESVCLGMEYGFMQRFFLRAGYQALFERDSEKGITAGMGFVYFLAPQTPLRLDYAYADWNRLTAVHRFSIEIGF